MAAGKDVGNVWNSYWNDRTNTQEPIVVETQILTIDHEKAKVDLFPTKDISEKSFLFAYSMQHSNCPEPTSIEVYSRLYSCFIRSIGTIGNVWNPLPYCIPRNEVSYHGLSMHRIPNGTLTLSLYWIEVTDLPPPRPVYEWSYINQEGRVYRKGLREIQSKEPYVLPCPTVDRFLNYPEFCRFDYLQEMDGQKSDAKLWPSIQDLDRI